MERNATVEKMLCGRWMVKLFLFGIFGNETDWKSWCENERLLLGWNWEKRNEHASQKLKKKGLFKKYLYTFIFHIYLYLLFSIPI